MEKKSSICCNCKKEDNYIIDEDDLFNTCDVCWEYLCIKCRGNGMCIDCISEIIIINNEQLLSDYYYIKARYHKHISIELDINLCGEFGSTISFIIKNIQKEDYNFVVDILIKIFIFGDKYYDNLFYYFEKSYEDNINENELFNKSYKLFLDDLIFKNNVDFNKDDIDRLCKYKLCIKDGIRRTYFS